MVTLEAVESLNTSVTLENSETLETFVSQETFVKLEPLNILVVLATLISLAIIQTSETLVTKKTLAILESFVGSETLITLNILVIFQHLAPFYTKITSENCFNLGTLLHSPNIKGCSKTDFKNLICDIFLEILILIFWLNLVIAITIYFSLALTCSVSKEVQTLVYPLRLSPLPCSDNVHIANSYY